jgi:hypothetical protein
VIGFADEPPSGRTPATTLSDPPRPSPTCALTFPVDSSFCWETGVFSLTERVPGFTADASRAPAGASVPIASRAPSAPASTRLLIEAWLISRRAPPPGEAEKT